MPNSFPPRLIPCTTGARINIGSNGITEQLTCRPCRVRTMSKRTDRNGPDRNVRSCDIRYVDPFWSVGGRCPSIAPLLMVPGWYSNLSPTHVHDHGPSSRPILGAISFQTLWSVLLARWHSQPFHFLFTWTIFL